MKKTILTVNETVQRSHEEGMPISDYSLRRAIRNGTEERCKDYGTIRPIEAE